MREENDELLERKAGEWQERFSSLIFFQPFQNVRLHHKQDKQGERDEILDSSRFIASHVWGMNFPLVSKEFKYRYVFQIIVHDNKYFRKV